MHNLNHKNIIKLIDILLDVDYIKKSGESYKVWYTYTKGGRGIIL